MSDEQRIGVTSRGFGLVTFHDHNRVECSLQQSSAIDLDSEDGFDRPGSSFVWLGCTAHPAGKPEGYVANTRMHLGRENVEMLILHLQNWLATGSFVNDRDVPRSQVTTEQIGDIELASPTYYEDSEPCGYCDRAIGQPHKQWCRQ